MLWRLVRKIARLYALLAIGVLALVLSGDKISSHQLNAAETMLALFFPYGVLTGLVLALLYMRAGGWIITLSLAGFYLVARWQTGVWPDDQLPVLAAGPGPLFLLAGFLKSMTGSQRKKKSRS